MKKGLFLGLMCISVLSLAQTSNEDLRKEIETIKVSVNNLRSEINEVKSENLYLKKIINLQKPILQIIKNDTEFRIIEVKGDKKNSSIEFTLLLESKDERKKFFIPESSIVDIDGNEVKINLDKSNYDVVLSKDVPQKIKLVYTYQDLPNDLPKIISVLRINANYKLLDTNPYGLDEKLYLELRDINVD